jgi:hypothetical protein
MICFFIFDPEGLLNADGLGLAQNVAEARTGPDLGLCDRGRRAYFAGLSVYFDGKFLNADGSAKIRGLKHG